MAQFPPVMSGVKALLYGGDYNPEQWLGQKDEIWQKDMELARKAGINTLSIGIFSWAHLEPEEGKYDFSWMDEVMDMLHKNGIKAVLATPSGARPVWMAEKHPEVLRVTPERLKNLYGGRHNHCLSSPYYREKVREMNTRLAERYGKHPALGLWHISNEYGGECHCPLCQKAFQNWLEERYGTIDNLNDAWWNQFWAHRYSSFDQIQSPSPIGEWENHGLKLNWRRFVSSQHISFYENEIGPMKRITPEIPCTTNLMAAYPGIDYFALGRHLDVSSWDNYPAWMSTNEDADVADYAAFRHDLMRGVGGNKPFLMMESSPSAVNWQPINPLRSPGTLKLQGLQAIAHGADSVQYFQFRKSRGSFEKFHGAVVDHVGNDKTRIYREVCETGKALQKLAGLTGSAAENKIALIYDWENGWALEDARFGHEDKHYEKTVATHHSALMHAGLGVDMQDQIDAFSKNEYRVVIAPMSYMLRSGFADEARTFVKEGGTLVLTYVSGYVNDDDLCFLGGFPGPLREVAGIWAEEVDALPEGKKNAFIYRGEKFEAVDFCELVHAETAKVLSVYESDFYKGMPALTVNEFGRGKCYYVAARTGADFLKALYADIAAEAGVKPVFPEIPHGIGVTKRVGEGAKEYLFVMNYLPAENAVDLPFEAVDLLTEKKVSGKTVIPARGVMVFKQ